MEENASLYAGKLCGYCDVRIRDFDTITVCPDCKEVYHKECWDEHKGCKTEGCPMQSVASRKIKPKTYICMECGEPLLAGQYVCPKCNTPKFIEKNVCEKCGTKIPEGQHSCPACGQRAGGPADIQAAAKLQAFDAREKEEKRKKKKIRNLILVILIVAVCAAGGVVVYTQFIDKPETSEQQNNKEKKKEGKKKQKNQDSSSLDETTSRVWIGSTAMDDFIAGL